MDGYGAYIKERDPEAKPSEWQKEQRRAKWDYVRDRTRDLMGTADLARAIQDDMSGHFGHESDAIAMLLSQTVKTGDFAALIDRVNVIAQDLAEREWDKGAK